MKRRIKVISSFPDGNSSMKAFSLKSIEFNSKHAFRKINGSHKCNDEIKKYLTRNTLYKYIERVT
jgi:hypothetical protein